MPPVLPLFPGLASPDSRAAIRFDDTSYDYATLFAACAALRRSLAKASLSSGDRVAIWAHPHVDTMLGFIGALSAGVITIPLNPGLGDKELAHIIADSKPDAILSAHPEPDQKRTPSVPVHGFAFEGDSVITPRQLFDRGEEDPLLILYTSGTTGAPKGAVLSAKNIAATLDGLIDAWALSSNDTIVHGLPLFHAHGLVFGLFGAMRARACLHWVPKFSPEAIAHALETSDSTVLYAVPTMYHRLIEAAEQSEPIRRGLSAARLLVSGSAALPAREHARIEALTGQRVCERYGLSETLINTAVRHDSERPAGYVGTPLPSVEVRLVDDQRKEIEEHDDKTIGEVCVRGPNVFLGYLDNEQATAKVLDDEGWFYTGDLGTIASNGFLRIVGRKATDLIKTGGFKVGAGEIEAALLEHPLVREAAVVGAPDDDLGERIVAFVVPRDPTAPPPEQALIEHVAQLKRPRNVRFVVELPRNAMGKVQKTKLRELLVEGGRS
jgi:malonyl-CoA/methylmalonyl-CoA synthetase